MDAMNMALQKKAIDLFFRYRIFWHLSSWGQILPCALVEMNFVRHLGVKAKDSNKYLVANMVVIVTI